MPSMKAEDGSVGGLDSLSMFIDMNTLGVHGNGTIGIESGSDNPTVKWFSKQRSWIRVPEDFGLAMTVRGERDKESSFVGSRQEPYRNRNDIDSYRSRIEYLRNEAEHDGYALSRDSEMDFQQFVRSVSGLRKGSLVLTDNGNIRAIWRDGHGSHLGLQFLGSRMVQYVVFKRRAAERQISRVAGRDSVDGILRQIDAFDLGSLLYE